jgi:hypothetical protein
MTKTGSIVSLILTVIGLVAALFFGILYWKSSSACSDLEKQIVNKDRVIIEQRIEIVDLAASVNTLTTGLNKQNTALEYMSQRSQDKEASMRKTHAQLLKDYQLALSKIPKGEVASTCDEGVLILKKEAAEFSKEWKK